MPLTVADLQAALATLPSDMPVILAKNGEGSGFSPLAATEAALYLAENTYSGEFYMTEDDRQGQDNPDEYEAAPDGSVPALFMWPTN